MSNIETYAGIIGAAFIWLLYILPIYMVIPKVNKTYQRILCAVFWPITSVYIAIVEFKRDWSELRAAIKESKKELN